MFIITCNEANNANCHGYIGMTGVSLRVRVIAILIQICAPSPKYNVWCMIKSATVAVLSVIVLKIELLIIFSVHVLSYSN